MSKHQRRMQLLEEKNVLEEMRIQLMNAIDGCQLTVNVCAHVFVSHAKLPEGVSLLQKSVCIVSTFLKGTIINFLASFITN